MKRRRRMCWQSVLFFFLEGEKQKKNIAVIDNSECAVFSLSSGPLLECHWLISAFVAFRWKGAAPSSTAVEAEFYIIITIVQAVTLVQHFLLGKKKNSETPPPHTHTQKSPLYAVSTKWRSTIGDMQMKKLPPKSIHLFTAIPFSN